jgi:drug/metabolite transporter (DMT)-like permease
MKPRDLLDLTLLAALWGGSFLFMRVAAPDFGPLALIGVRLASAAALLVAWLALTGELRLLQVHAWPLLVVGVLNSALPFCLFAWALLSVSAGFAAILNATSPLWGALIARVWLRERLGRWRIAGLVIGLAGVVLLVWGRAGLQPGGEGWPVLAGLAGGLSYGLAGHYTRRHLSGVPSLAVAAGSQCHAAIALAPLAWYAWPQQLPSVDAWAAALVLGLACTGVAYVLYFRLIANVGPSRAITVTFLVPAFAMTWGALFLGEQITAQMALACAVVLAGTALSTGALDPERLRRSRR